MATRPKKPTRTPSDPFQRWLISQLRRLSYRQPQSGRTQAFARARISRGIYQCEGCGGTFTSSQVQADHVLPVVDPELGFIDWDTYISRLFVKADGYQILCSGVDSCHQKKTNSENARRKK
jgi:5-methylcytosine-specific restriction endonuclease McrA